MQRWGMMTLVLLATAIALALTSASALAATPIQVTETTDAPLEAGASTCESTDLAKGCTLRAAVELADSEGQVTIDVPEGTYEETASEPTLVIKDDAEVTISGAGAEKTIIEGNATASVLEVEADSSLTLDGVTVTNGNADEGAGVYVEGFADLTVEKLDDHGKPRHRRRRCDLRGIPLQSRRQGSTITENVAEDDGGAIYAEDGAYVSVQESKITKNRAHRSGGGIYSERDAVVVIDKSTLAEDEAKDEGGGIDAYIPKNSASRCRSHQALVQGPPHDGWRRI